MSKFITILLTSLFSFFISMFFIGELIERKNNENRNK